MPVVTRPYPQQAEQEHKKRGRKASALFRRESIERGRTLFERIVGVALLFGSGIGNYLAFNAGGFAPLNVEALVFSLISLAILTALQWFYRPDIDPDAWWFHKIVDWCAGLTWKYSASVLIGVGLTVYGAQAIALPILQNVLGGLVSADMVAPLSWLLLIVVSLVVEVIPENILVD